MDRSNVGNNYKETILRQSFVFNTGGTNNLQRSFINTALVNDSLAFGDDLRKSRIQNLPNYKKTNLGDNIQFIVVFQTIEIERLSSEIEVLRVKLKEYERQLFNASNYEVQIRQLTEKCFAMERERQEYHEEVQKINRICQTLYHENQMLKSRLSQMDISLKQKFESQKLKNAELMQQIEKWKSRYQASEKSKAKELEDLRNLMECQRKSMIDRQIRQMTIRFQNQRSALQNEIRKGRQLLENRNRQIDDYKQRIQKMEIQVMELRNYESILTESENKIAMLSQQMLRLNQVLGAKEDELSNMRQREQRLNQQLKEQGEWENQNKRLKQLIETRTKQLEDWKVRNARLQDQVVRAKELNHYVEQLQNKVNLASKQIDRLNNVLREKINEIQQWKKRLSDKEMELGKLKNLEYELQGYQTKMSNLKIQNDRINGILKSRLGEIEEWKNRYAQLQAKLNQYAYVQKDKKALEEKFNSQIKNNEQLKFMISKLQQELTSFKKQQGRYIEIERNNQSLNKEIERLNNLLRNNNNEIQSYKSKINNLQQTFNEYRNIEIKVKDFEHKIIMLTQQIERLNQLINQKNGLIANLEKDQLDLHSKINHYKSYEQKIQQSESYIRKYQQQIDNIKKELDGWQRKAKEADAKAQRVEGELFKHAQEKDRLSNMLKTKNNEYETLRGSLANYEAEARKVQHLQATCEQLNNHIMGLVGDIQVCERNSKTLQQELEKERQFTNEFAFKIIILSAQVERLSKQGGSSGVKSKQFLELQENYSRLQSKVQSKNNEIDMLHTKITNLESKISQLYQQFNRLLQEAQKSERETQVLLRKIEEYQDYARRIHILGNEIDQLNKEKSFMQEELRTIRLRYADNINFEEKQNSVLIKIVLMAAQIESLRAKVEQREMTAEEMRKSIIDPFRKI